MKKISIILLVLFVLVGLLTACTETLEEETPTLEPEYELCSICGEHYVHEELRAQTPPLHIHEIQLEWPLVESSEAAHVETVDAFLNDFDTVHTVTYIQWDTEWYASLVIWSDEPLRNVSFLSLGFDYAEERPYFYTRAELLTVDELLPNDALLLNVAFEHYLVPRGGLIFTDENGVERRMFISESMRGGCFPQFHLLPYDTPDVVFADWN